MKYKYILVSIYLGRFINVQKLSTEIKFHDMSIFGSRARLEMSKIFYFCRCGTVQIQPSYNLGIPLVLTRSITN